MAETKLALSLLENFGLPVAIAVVMGWVAWKVLKRYLDDLTVRLNRAEERIDELQDTLFTEMKALVKESHEQDIKNTQAVLEWLKEMREWRNDMKEQYKQILDKIEECIPDAIEQLLEKEAKLLIKERMERG